MKTCTNGQLWDVVYMNGMLVNKAYSNGQQFYQAPPISLTNLIINGSFEVNTSGWTNLTSRIARPTPNNGEAGSYAGSFNAEFNTEAGGPTGQLLKFTTASSISVVSGHKYYIRGLVHKGDSISPSVGIWNGEQAPGAMGEVPITTPIALVNTPSINTWYLLDSIWTANTSSLRPSIHVMNNTSGNYPRIFTMDNFMLIDLTQSYKAGKEPDISSMRSIITRWSNYFDGTVEY